MLIKEGNNQEEMLSLLEELNELTAIDSLIRTNAKVTLQCIKKNGKLGNWRLESTPSRKPQKPFASGRNLKKFMRKLDSLNEESFLFEEPDCNVLCHVSTEAAKTWDGKICSHWINLMPGMPYTIEDGELKFQTIELELTQEEHEWMTAVGLTFYCESSGVYYPLTELSFCSIGRLLDCTMAFTNIDRHLLGSAILLAEKMTYAKQIRIIHRARGKKIRPVISIAGYRYQLFSQHTFFKDVMAIAAAQYGIYEVKHWSISDEVSTLDLLYPSPWKEYQFGLIVQTGDIPQYAFTVMLYVQIEDAIIPLLTNTKSHANTFERENIKELFSGIEEEISRFENTYQTMEHSICSFDSESLTCIHNILGKRRLADKEDILSGEYSSLPLFMEILHSRYLQLPQGQMIRLQKEFKTLFYQIAETSIEMKETKFA